MKNKKLVIILLVIIIVLIFLSTVYINLNSEVLKNIKPEVMENNFKATYELESSNDTNSVVKLLFESGIGIEKIIYPESTRELNCNGGKQQVSIDYTAENNKVYEFRIKEIGKEEQTYELVVTGKSQIIETQESKYPIVTSNSVGISKTVDIDYQYNENCRNYYSLDGGQTWEEYIERIKFVADGNIKVKTETENNIITPIETRDIKIELATDAVGLAAYDGNSNTNYRMGSFDGQTKYLVVDSSAVGKTLHIRVNPTSLAYGMNCKVRAIDANGSLLGTEYSTVYATQWDIVIPENTAKIAIIAKQAYYINDIYIKDTDSNV